jgi:bifunctional non-homologous end joining protein LigD
VIHRADINRAGDSACGRPDGEAACCDPDGTANVERLHSKAHNDQAFLYAFDLLELGGIDLRVEPLEERRGRLEHLLRKVTAPGVQFNEHIEGDGQAIFAHACRLGFEGASSRSTERTRINRGRASRG